LFFLIFLIFFFLFFLKNSIKKRDFLTKNFCENMESEVNMSKKKSILYETIKNDVIQIIHISILVGLTFLVCLFFYGSISYLPQLFGFYMNRCFWLKMLCLFVFTVIFLGFIIFKEEKVNMLSSLEQIGFYVLIVLQVIFNITYVVLVSIDVNKTWMKVDTPMNRQTAREIQVFYICLVGIDIFVQLVLCLEMFKWFKNVRILQNISGKTKCS